MRFDLSCNIRFVFYIKVEKFMPEPFFHENFTYIYGFDHVMQLPYKRIIVKIGSNVLTRKDRLPDLERIEQLVEQVARLRKEGMEIILVSSGAVAFGRSLINDSGKYDTVAARQLLASTGQVHLINAFARFFAQHQTLCSQVLVTKEDFRDRLHYLHMKNCFEIDRKSKRLNSSH